MTSLNRLSTMFQTLRPGQPLPAGNARAAVAIARPGDELGLSPAAKDPGLAAALGSMNRAIASKAQALQAIDRELAAATSQVRKVQLLAQREETAKALRMDRGLLHLGRQPAANAQQMAQLLQEAAHTTDGARRGTLQVAAEDLVRNAGRQPASDRGLYNATQGLQRRLGQLDDHTAQLTQELANTTDQARMAQIQLQMDDDERQLRQLQGLKLQADRLADNPAASPADVERVSALMQEAGQTTDPRRLAQIQVEAADVARNAGRAVPTDRGVANGLSALATRDGDLQDQMKQLAVEANAGTDRTRLTQIQLEIDDLQRTRDQLQQLRKAGEHAADRADLTPASAQRLANLLAEASQTTDVVRLRAITLEARTLR
jgi:hypothetical protein